MITYQDFYRLEIDASEFETVESYIEEVGGSVHVEDVDKTIKILGAIYKIARSGNDFGVIAETCEQSKRGLAVSLGIPTRTTENWCQGTVPPAWQMSMVAYAALANWMNE